MRNFYKPIIPEVQPYLYFYFYFAFQFLSACIAFPTCSEGSDLR